MESVPQEEEQLIGSFFIDTDYQEIIFEYKDIKQKLYALKAASTDFDLTGQIIWKAADILSKYIIDYLGEAELKGKTILELGSGPGLCSLVAQHWSSCVVLSDYQDVVMDLININLKDTDPIASTCQLMSTQLDWYKVKDNYDTLAVHKYDNGLKQVCTLGEMQFDYVIGSDIVFWPRSVEPLMNVLTVSSISM